MCESHLLPPFHFLTYLIENNIESNFYCISKLLESDFTVAIFLIFKLKLHTLFPFLIFFFKKGALKEGSAWFGGLEGLCRCGSATSSHTGCVAAAVPVFGEHSRLPCG